MAVQDVADGSGQGGAVAADRPAEALRTVRAFDGARLAVRAQGGPAAPATVVLVHGWTLTADGWGPHIARLTHRRAGRVPPRVVSFDLRAHGRSERGTAPVTAGTLAADLAEVLAQCAPEGPVVLVGHSLGGMAVLELADAWPELFAGGGGPIAGTVLVSTCAGGASPVSSRAQRSVLEALIGHPRLGELVRRLITGPGAHPRTLPLWRLALGSGPDAEMARRSAEDWHDVPLHDIVEFYRAVECHDCHGRLGALAGVPTSVLVGSEDKFMTPALAAALAAQIPGARLRLVPGYGHDLPYDRPDVVVDAVEDILARLPGTEAGVRR